jgi:hypothetical protein
MTGIGTSTAGAEVHPFRINVAEEDLVDLRHRILATRWPDREIEARLNALPRHITEIDGPDIHLIHVTAHGGDAEDAFDVVVPSMPGYAFSERPTSTGWARNASRRAGPR